MIELMLVVCLKLQPTACEERSLLTFQEVGVLSCMMQAPPQLAQWSEAHPKLQVVRWTCRPANARGVKA